MSQSYKGKEEGLINGTIVLFGGQINMLDKKLFMELGAGYAEGEEYKGGFW